MISSHQEDKLSKINARLESFNFRILAVLVSVFAIIPRLLFINVPFERDEGAYAYVADCMLRDGVPYVSVFDHKPPLIYYFYKLSFLLFGHSTAAPRLLTCFFVATACLFTLIWVRKLSDNLLAAVFSCILLGFVSASPAYFGFTANTEIFALPFLLGGLLFLAEDDPSFTNCFYSGLLFGLGIMVKQPVAIIAVSAGVVHLFADYRSVGRILIKACIFIAALLLPFVLFCIYFMYLAEFKHFWECFYTYNVIYATNVTTERSLNNLSKTLIFILNIDLVVWISGLVGLLIWLKTVGNSKMKYYVAATATGSVFAVALGGSFYPHYFIFILPFLVLGSGLGVSTLLTWQKQTIAACMILATLFFSVWQYVISLSMTSQELLKWSYGDLPFYQAKLVGDYLSSTTRPGTSTFIIGSEPEILFYARHKAPSRFFYIYPLTREHVLVDSMRKDLFSDLNQRIPSVLVYVNSELSQGVSFKEENEFIKKLSHQFTSYRLGAFIGKDSDELITDINLLRSGINSADLDGAILVFFNPSMGVNELLPSLGSIKGLNL